MVLRVCRRVLQHPQDAEDAFQATFLVLARRAASIRKQGAVGSWLQGVACNLASKARARRACRQTHERRAAQMKKEPGVKAAWQEVQAALDEALVRLPEKYREALVLCYLQGDGHEEAARRLGCPVATLRCRLARGRKLLRAGLERRGLALTAGGLAALLAAGAADAAVPAALVQPTLRAAARVAAGESAAKVVSVGVAHLVEEGLTIMMPVARFKICMVCVAALGLFMAGVGIIAGQTLATPGAGGPRVESGRGQGRLAESRREEVSACRPLWRPTPERRPGPPGDRPAAPWGNCLRGRVLAKRQDVGLDRVGWHGPPVGWTQRQPRAAARRSIR